MVGKIVQAVDHSDFIYCTLLKSLIILEENTMDKTWVSYLDRFADTVRKYANDTAIICGDRKFNYSELDGASNAVAKALQSCSVKREQIVPIVLPRGPEAFAAMLGVWKAGAAGTFVNTAYPAERIEEICRLCGSACVIDEKWIQEHDPFGQAPAAAFESAVLEREQLAMVIFTSGSTGSPKGVLIPHRALSHRVVSAREMHMAVQPYERKKEIWLSFLPVSSVVVVSSEFTVLILGATIVIAPAEFGFDMTKIVPYGLQHGINYNFVPPVLAPIFMKYFEGKLRVLGIGAERVKNVFSDSIILFNGYGASETTSLCFAFRIDRHYESAPIGKPLTGTGVYLLDSRGQPVPEGEMGELCLSGEGIALGYLGRPDLTAEKFTVNPFSNDPDHHTLYHSGDLVKRLPDGNYEYIQRADWMLKVRGHRVEPGEIESAICKVAPVTKAVVVGFDSRGEEPAQTRLYACFTADESIDPKKIQEDIAKILPDYMVPAYIEQLSALPLNLNGKIDRSKIIPPEIEYFKSDYEAPANDMEKTICGAFQQVLHLPRVGALDNFILIGGDSVTAAKLAFMIFESTGISVVDILLHHTPRALAALAHTKLKDRERYETTASIEIKDSSALELSPYQVIFYNEWLLNPNRYDYNIVEDKIFEGEISADRLNNSLVRFYKNYFLFNCNVAVDGDVLYWKNREDVADDAQILQYFDHPIDDKELFSLVSKPFDLKNDLLYRYFLIKLADRQYRYITCVHHIMIDGTKANAVYKEYANYYNDPGYSGVVDITKQQMLFAGYLVTLRSIMDKNRENMINFWREHCRDAEAVDLQFLRGAQDKSSGQSLSPVSICHFSVDQKDTDRVKIVSQKYGITPYIYAEIIFALALHRMSGQKKISFSYPVIIPEGLALMFGSQINTLIISFSFDQETSVDELIRQAKNFYIDIEKNHARYLPISDISQFLPDRKILDISFSQSSLRDSSLAFNGVEKETVNEDFFFDANCTLLAQMEELNNQLHFKFKYKNGILDDELVLKFSKIYQRLFGDILNGLLNEYL